MTDSPIFLVDSDCSDSTLLRLMLNAHPQVTWLHEFEQTNQMPVGHMLTYPELVSSLLDQYKSVAHKYLAHKSLIGVSGAKLHQHFGPLLTRWPEAKFIRIVRDPREMTCASVRRGRAGNVWAGLGHWIETEAAWDKLSPQLCAEKTLEIYYQDLITDTRPTLEKVCALIEVPYSPAMMDKVTRTNPSLLHPQRVQTWQRHLSKREIQLIEARIGPQMVARGFAYSGFAKRKVSLWQRSYLRMQDRLTRVSFRIKRYGLGLFLGDFITRRLCAHRLNRTYRQKINKIQLSQLKKSW